MSTTTQMIYNINHIYIFLLENVFGSNEVWLREGTTSNIDIFTSLEEPKTQLLLLLFVCIFRVFSNSAEKFVINLSIFVHTQRNDLSRH